jgi:hypothetical protein
MLNHLLALREQIIQGDFRSLHIVWLVSIALEEGAHDKDEVQEQPSPPGLHTLDSGIHALAEFFAVDLNLILDLCHQPNPSPLPPPSPA